MFTPNLVMSSHNKDDLINSVIFEENEQIDAKKFT
jgi:hypothetical protein